VIAMTTFLATLVAFGVVTLLLGLGSLIGRHPLEGSCGGLGGRCACRGVSGSCRLAKDSDILDDATDSARPASRTGQ
jgi:hypothetical protein